jgi:hypothetical protein
MFAPTLKDSTTVTNVFPLTIENFQSELKVKIKIKKKLTIKCTRYVKDPNSTDSSLVETDSSMDIDDFLIEGEDLKEDVFDQEKIEILEDERKLEEEEKKKEKELVSLN